MMQIGINIFLNDKFINMTIICKTHNYMDDKFDKIKNRTRIKTHGSSNILKKSKKIMGVTFESSSNFKVVENEFILKKRYNKFINIPQVQQVKNKPLNLFSPKSPLIKANLKEIFNIDTWKLLESCGHDMGKLKSLLPSFDKKILLKDVEAGHINAISQYYRPSLLSILHNEYLSASLVEWKEKLRNGQFKHYQPNVNQLSLTNKVTKILSFSKKKKKSSIIYSKKRVKSILRQESNLSDLKVKKPLKKTKKIAKRQTKETVINVITCAQSTKHIIEDNKKFSNNLCSIQGIHNDHNYILSSPIKNHVIKAKKRKLSLAPSTTPFTNVTPISIRSHSILDEVDKSAFVTLPQILTAHCLKKTLPLLAKVPSTTFDSNIKPFNVQYMQGISCVVPGQCHRNVSCETFDTISLDINRKENQFNKKILPNFNISKGSLNLPTSSLSIPNLPNSFDVIPIKIKMPCYGMPNFMAHQNLLNKVSQSLHIISTMSNSINRPLLFQGPPSLLSDNNLLKMSYNRPLSSILPLQKPPLNSGNDFILTTKGQTGTIYENFLQSLPPELKQTFFSSVSQTLNNKTAPQKIFNIPVTVNDLQNEPLNAKIAHASLLAHVQSADTKVLISDDNFFLNTCRAYSRNNNATLLCPLTILPCTTNLLSSSRNILPDIINTNTIDLNVKSFLNVTSNSIMDSTTIQNLTCYPVEKPRQQLVKKENSDTCNNKLISLEQCRPFIHNNLRCLRFDSFKCIKLPHQNTVQLKLPLSDNSVTRLPIPAVISNTTNDFNPSRLGGNYQFVQAVHDQVALLDCPNQTAMIRCPVCGAYNHDSCAFVHTLPPSNLLGAYHSLPKTVRCLHCRHVFKI